jgi:predicted aminopeptidase
MPSHTARRRALPCALGDGRLAHRREAPDLCQLARDRWDDTVLLSEFLDRLWSDLDALYSENLPLDSLVPRRRALLTESAERFRREFAPRMRTPGFARYDPTRLNNASLIARHLYYHRLPVFQSLYQSVGDLHETIDRVAAAVADMADPWQAIGQIGRHH